MATKIHAFIMRFTRYRRVYLDTSIFIYHLEDHPRFAPLTQVVFDRLERGRCHGVTSTLTILELNVRPYAVDRSDLALSNIALLGNFPHLTIVPVTLPIGDRAAQLRAQYRLRTPDAVHGATALHGACDCLLANDRHFRKMRHVAYLHLSDFA
ncbi:MAG: type II toxin-antitoxin system VapC family toxin [Deltaproteobacteria bacterium]|nr:type II toxin-antitoxin system VapC family toxin [Deltaproteobacteria bacterium]